MENLDSEIAKNKKRNQHIHLINRTYIFFSNASRSGLKSWAVKLTSFNEFRILHQPGRETEAKEKRDSKYNQVSR